METVTTEQGITDFLITVFGFRKYHSKRVHDDDNTDFRQFDCVLRIGDVHYLYWSENLKHFTLALKHENPKGESGKKGVKFWSYMDIPKPIYDNEQALNLVNGICAFDYMKCITQ